MIIEARLAGGDSDTVNDGDGVLAVVERREYSLNQLGLTLAERRSLLAKVQAELISKQVQWWLLGQAHCRLCGAPLHHKDSRSTVLRTVYGKVIVKSPRLWSCTCEQTTQTSRRVVHPLSKTLTRRVTPELEYLQAKWAAHLPYRQAPIMLKDVVGKTPPITSVSTAEDPTVEVGFWLSSEEHGARRLVDLAAAVESHSAARPGTIVAPNSLLCAILDPYSGPSYSNSRTLPSPTI